MKLLISTTLFISFLISLIFNHIETGKTAISKKNNKQGDQDITVTVNNSKPGIKIPDNFLGLSYEITALTDTVYFKANHTKYINLLNNLGDGVLRLNGYYINYVTWASHKRTPIMSKDNNSYLTDSVATTDLDTLFSFMRKTKWKVILGINFRKGYPDLTYSEVNYAWSKGKDVMLAFELGNEPDGLYKLKFDDFYNAIIPHYDILKSKLPGVPLCGPASLYPKYFIKDWLQKASDKVNFVTVHEYDVNVDKPNENISQLLDNKYIEAANHFSYTMDSLVSEKNIRYRLGECNNYADGGPNIADKFAAALWGIDYMFTLANNKALGVNFHGGNVAFSPILIKKNAPMVPQSLYYGMLFFHLASQGNILPVKISNNANPSVKAYSVLGANNKVYVTLLNKDPNNDVTIHLNSKNKLSAASFIRLISPSVSSKDSITFGGAAVDKYGKWKATSITKIASQDGVFNLILPKGSATLVTMN